MSVHGTENVISIVRALGPLDEWIKHTTANGTRPVPVPGSSLMGDDRATDPYHVSHAAWRGFSGAVDHLNTVKSLLVDAQTFHLYSSFSLIRAALENAATTVWLLTPNSRRERVLRRLRQAAADMVNTESLAQVMRASMPRTLDERQDDLRRIGGQRQIQEAEFIGRRQRPGYREIVEAAGESAGMGGRAAVAVWKACSAIAHGDMFTTIGLMERTEISQQGNIVQMSMAAPVRLLTTMTYLAVAMTDRAWRLYDDRRQMHRPV